MKHIVIFLLLCLSAWPAHADIVGGCPVTSTSSSGSGTVTSFSADNFSPLFTTSVANATSTPALSFVTVNQNPNIVYAGPTTGAATAPTFRALVGADLPNPSATTLGGVESITSTSHNFLTSISTSGVPSKAQPAFSDLSGSATCAQLPAFTGDITTSAGSCGTTLATVNSSVGSFTSANITVNAKGLITAASNGTGGGGLSPITNSLTSDVVMTVGGTYYDGPTVAQGSSGTWFASGTITILPGSSGEIQHVKLWDGTTVIASAAIHTNDSTAGGGFPVSLSGYLASPAGNIRMSATTTMNANINDRIVFDSSGESMDSTISAFRVQ